jgi:hypothetical protein
VTKDLRETRPLPRYIWHTRPEQPGLRGSDRIRWYGSFQRMSEAWYCQVQDRKDTRGQLVLPSGRSGYREEWDGSIISHHLNTFAESITMNVGGPCGEGCSPPMKRTGVGAAIVLGARESRVQGEGPQGSDVRWTNSRRSSGEVQMELGYPGRFDERKPMTALAGSRHSLESRMR